MAGEFSVLICRKRDLIIPLRKSNKTQAYPNFTKNPDFFPKVPDKGFVRVELGEGRVLHDLYSTCRHFWQILYKCSTGVSSTSTGVIYAFITPNPASKSCHSHTSFSMQTFQVNFLPFYSNHKKPTHLGGLLLPCWFWQSWLDIYILFLFWCLYPCCSIWNSLTQSCRLSLSHPVC